LVRAPQPKPVSGSGGIPALRAGKAGRTAPKNAQKRYEKPLITESSGMIFPESVWEDFSNGEWRSGCTECNRTWC
jgi:hypothetical protein